MTIDGRQNINKIWKRIPQYINKDTFFLYFCIWKTNRKINK